MRIIIALILFSILILVHEFGHFLLAKTGGIQVNEFSLGMGPRILSKKIGSTRYSLKLFPFGGSCAMEGEDEDSASPGAFGNASVLRRIAVVVAGPFFNFILAFVFSLIIIGCEGYDEPILYAVTDGFPAQAAGMEAGDRIVKMNDTSIHIYREVSLFVDTHQGETTTVVYERDGERHTVVLEPQLHENGMYYLGFTGSGIYTKGGFFKTCAYSLYEVKYWMSVTIKSLSMLIHGQVKATEVSGAVGIVNTIGEVYEQSAVDGLYYIVMNMLYMAVLLSANLGVMNLLPIPALDGGRLLFLLIELVRGKPVPQDKEAMVHFAGFVLLMVLMVLILFNDIRNIFM